MGRKEFDDWSDRIISGALCPADVDSQKYVLCDLLLRIDHTESHKPDAYFIHSLRKIAVNQVAIAIRTELHEKKKAADEAKKTDEQRAVEKAGEETLQRAREIGAH